LEKTLQKIPLLRFTLALAAGIALSLFFHVNWQFLLFLLIGFLSAGFLLNRFYSYKIASYWGITIQICFVLTGMLVYSLHNQKPEFYDEGNFSARVIEIPEEKANSYQAVLEVDAVAARDSILPTREKVMAWFEKSQKAEKLKPGDQLVFKRAPNQVKSNNNPFQFDYKSYLARKNIYRQVYIPDDDWRKVSSGGKLSVAVFAERIRMQLLKIYREQKLHENELQIMSALTLGYKRDLDPEIRRVFASAGAMHVLAVSGLHVGIVYLMLNILLGFLRRQKTGRILFVVIVIFALWFFAFLTGLSPSVSRAATMFTFVVVGKNLRRQTNIYNTLAASAFFLLLINPNNLFEVGFQLSYSAVFGIIFLQPRFEKLVNIPYKVPLYFWKLLTVSVAAQIATFPISVFYFNQFPVFFWISNLFVIPAVVILIPSGMLLLAFHSVPFISGMLSAVINFVLGIVYTGLQFVDNLPGSIIKISIWPVELIFLAAAILLLFVFIESRRKNYFKLSLFMFLLLTVSVFVSELKNKFRKEIIVYNEQENTLIHLISGDKNYVISENEIAANDYSSRIIETTVTKYRLNGPVFLTANSKYEDENLYLDKNLISFEGKTIQILKWNSEIYRNLAPEIVIGPASVFDDSKALPEIKHYVSTSRYASQNLSEKLPVHSLTVKGAFREKW
jgi:competence protein ComEC